MANSYSRLPIGSESGKRRAIEVKAKAKGEGSRDSVEKPKIATASLTLANASELRAISSVCFRRWLVPALCAVSVVGLAAGAAFNQELQRRRQDSDGPPADMGTPIS